ncbi:MAG: hypothetical protein ACO3JL_13475 [Myxococcota bacterium]
MAWPLSVSCAVLLACSPGPNTYDPIEADAGPAAPTGPSAADIGTKCEYRGDGANPSNTCPAGLSCLLYTYDGLYIPKAPGGTQNFTAHIWDDHFTVYRDDGIDEGYCTVIGTWAAPPICPRGTELKLFETNLAVCLRSCSAPSDCGRERYTCDTRFLDVGPTCVTGCSLDVPQCIRSGVFAPAQGNASPARYLAADDLAGASTCDVASGICAPNLSTGDRAPGQPCATTSDCELESVCIQAPLLQAIDGSLPANTTGFCAQPCKPDPQNPLSGGCRTGFACQQGFTLGHGPPFALISLQNGQTLEAGGVCFPDCQATGGACDSYPGTTCGQPRTALFTTSMLGSQPWSWNQVSMCLPDSLRR